MNWLPFVVVSVGVIISYTGIPGPINASESTLAPDGGGGGGGGVTSGPGHTPAPGHSPAPSGGSTDSPGHAPVVHPCPAQCRKINRFTCGDWIERADGSNNTIWNWNGRYCALTTERRSWMLSQNCVPFETQKERIFWSKKDCKNTCKPCVK